jgi:hypothetical protein
MRAAAASAFAFVLVASPARGERPSFAPDTEPRLHDGELGRVRVHYVTTSADAVPPDDADGDEVPDYVEEVAELAEIAWDDLEGRGFRPPVSDAGLVDDDGGDGRFDIYLRNLVAADGNFTVEACTAAPAHCAGYFAMENDLAGFSYATRTEGISVLTSHELFHAVQNAYAPDMPFAWSEGTAVWNEEQTFPGQGDYERFVADFLAHPQRPFDRSGTADAYAYGAALWPTFLDEWYGDGTVQRSWEACEAAGEGANFLDAIDQLLGEEGGSLASAWTEFSRWNLFTGERADPARAYAQGASLASVATEAPIAALGPSATSIEGMSARYLPVALPAQADPLRLTVAVDDGAEAAFFPIEGGAVGEEIELNREEDSGLLATRLEPDRASGMIVLSGVRRGGLPRDVTAEIGIAPPDAGGGDGGCQAARSGSAPGSAVLLLAAVVLLSLRRPWVHHRKRRIAMKSPVCAAALAAAAFSACTADIRPEDFGVDAAPLGKVNVTPNGDGTQTVLVDARNYEEWVYVDLTEVALREPADPLTSADWDLGLQRFHYALDGGVSGAGQGALIVIDGAEMADVSEAPADGWVTDEPDDEVDADLLPEYAFETAEGGWYDYDDVTHALGPKPRVYIVRGGAGALFALRIDDYYSVITGSAAWPRFTVKPL